MCRAARKLQRARPVRPAGYRREAIRAAYRRRTGNFRDRETRGRLIREHLIYSFTVRRAWWVPHGGPPCGPGDEACRAHVGGFEVLSPWRKTARLHPRSRSPLIQLGQWWVFGGCSVQRHSVKPNPTGRSHHRCRRNHKFLECNKTSLLPKFLGIKSH